MTILTLNRPALIDSSPTELDAEYRSARWIHHRLLDFEAEHQAVLDAAAEASAPGIIRVGRLLALLARRVRRAEHASEGSWRPAPRSELTTRLRSKLAELRAVRNADSRWKAALGWADEQIGKGKQSRRRRAKAPGHVKRRKNETDEAYTKRFDLWTHDESDEHYAAKVAAQAKKTRRDAYRDALYAKRSIYWGTWNALCRSVDQALGDVLERRKQGLPAEWRRPKFRDPLSLCADAGKRPNTGGVRVIDREGLWWIVEVRLGIGKGNKGPAVYDEHGRQRRPAEWVRLRTKGGNWHALGEHAEIKTSKLTRRRDGETWSYTISLTIEGVEKSGGGTTGGPGSAVAFDWGHREHGHPNADEGIRAFTWLGSDEEKGEIRIPAECRRALDEIDAMKTRLDTTYDARRTARSLPDRNRYLYRRRLMLSGARTAEETAWLRWEMRYERRIAKRRKRVANLRRETYIRAIRELRSRYQTFVFEGERLTGPTGIRAKQTAEEMPRRKRANRDMATRYEFVSLCERLGASVETVSARNTTRECPEPGCNGLLAENGPELIVVCPKCGTARDKDEGAARVILARWLGTLANHPQAAE